jgi:hypothetical protein
MEKYILDIDTLIRLRSLAKLNDEINNSRTLREQIELMGVEIDDNQNKYYVVSKLGHKFEWEEYKKLALVGSTISKSYTNSNYTNNSSYSKTTYNNHQYHDYKPKPRNRYDELPIAEFAF